MMDLIKPAPLWRRMAALSYDSLLLIGLWLSGTLIAVLLRDAAHASNAPHWLMRLWLMAIGFGFFGWSWTHGGRTPGMLAWRIQLRRTDGGPVLWSMAFVRYCAAWLSWLTVLGALWSLRDPRRRALHDIIAGTEMIVLPKRGTSDPGDATPSSDPA